MSGTGQGPGFKSQGCDVDIIRQYVLQYYL